MIFYRISELMLATLMPHFMIVLITYINLLNLFLDNKMSIFEEYGAFKFPDS